MPFELRILLFCRDASPALRALDAPGFSVCAVALHEAQLFSLAADLQPHVILFYDMPAQPDTLSAQIAALCPLSPPRLVCRAPGFDAADAFFDDNASLCRAIQSACDIPVGKLAVSSMPKRLALADTLLTELGMPAQLLGRESILLSAAWLSAMPAPILPFKHFLYPLLARKLNISPSAVERRIRSAVESTWLHGSIMAQSKLFGFTVSAERGKPTNAEFLYLLAEHIRRQL